MIADDLGWQDVGYAGSTFYDTPNIDALAAASLRFDEAYAASPVCSPSRAAILTGKDPVRFGITDIINETGAPNGSLMTTPPTVRNLPLSVTTIAEYLKSSGYSTYFAGKWHLGETAQYWPENRGYDVNIGGSMLGNPNGNPPNQWNSPYNNPRLTGPAGEFLEDRLAKETVNYILSHGKSGKPFFITHAFYLPHVPMVNLKPYISKYQARWQALKRPFPVGRFLKYGLHDQYSQSFPAYGTMVQTLDDEVGKIIAALKAAHVENNTIIVFVSDNGGYSPDPWGGTSNTPLRGGKGWLYEGGIRVPMLISAPGVTTPGSRTDYPVRGEDIVPTLLDLARVSYAGATFDGTDIFANNRPKAREFYWHVPHYFIDGAHPEGSVISAGWKLIEFFEDNSVELYDLSTDPNETTDLSNLRPDIVTDLRQKLTDYQRRVGAKMPMPR